MSRLEATRLSVTPPGAAEPAIEDRSLAVLEGERVGLAGPNGSGKTSLLLGLAGLWPSSGELRLDGVPFRYGGDPAARRGLALVQQDPSSQLLQGTVFDELAFALRNLGTGEEEIRQRVGRLSERLGLTSELCRDPTRLSAGRQQMVLLGAALAPSPAVLLADEPTAHMDPRGRDLALRAVAEHAAAGLAVVWASQSAEELAAMDRVLELEPSAPASLPTAGVVHAVPGARRLRVRVSALDRGATRDGPHVRTDHPVTIEVAERGISAVVGPNGAGKSVILGAIAGLGSSPQIEIEWLAPAEPPPIAALQFPDLQIFQEAVSDEITYASVSRGRTAAQTLAEAANWLRRLDFDPDRFLGRRTWSLALGAKRLTEVIGALVAPACVYLLDEPTAGLDRSRRARLGQLLAELAADRPIVVATQDREWLAAMGAAVTDLAPAESAKTPI